MPTRLLLKCTDFSSLSCTNTCLIPQYQRPKPDRIAVLVTAAFLGWLMLRSRVLNLFKLCKDLEFVCLLHLFEEVLPLLFFHYPVVFRSSNLENYLNIMRRFAVLFTCWRRRHYDKSTLLLLSDTAHQKVSYLQKKKFKKGKLFQEINHNSKKCVKYNFLQ